MSYAWFEEVAATAPLTQGDLLCDCPVVRWSYDPQPEGQQTEDLQQLSVAEVADCIVMSQACDLEHGHLRDVILCPTYTISEYRPLWQNAMEVRQQNPTQKSWARFLDDVSNGSMWNLAMINSYSPSDENALQAELRLVDFHEILSLPRIFLEAWTIRAAVPRLRLLPPYREHLSQAFARYFMRVGLPLDITKTW
jgi:hypothetical protein